MTRPVDPALAAILETGRLAILARHEAELADYAADTEARLRAAAPEVYADPECTCGGCAFWVQQGLATKEEVDAAAERARVSANEIWPPTDNEKEEAAAQ